MAYLRTTASKTPQRRLNGGPFLVKWTNRNKVQRMRGFSSLNQAIGFQRRLPMGAGSTLSMKGGQ